MEEIKTKEPTAAELATGDNSQAEFYGKFKNKEGLMDAYRSLEAEFTRRSQRLKELESVENQRAEADKWSRKVDELTAKYPVAANLTDEIAAVLENRKELLKEENCLETALLTVLAEKKKKKRDEGGGRTPPKVSVKKGEIPLVTPVRPTSIREAGKIAEKILKSNG